MLSDLQTTHLKKKFCIPVIILNMHVLELDLYHWNADHSPSCESLDMAQRQDLCKCVGLSGEADHR